MNNFDWWTITWIYMSMNYFMNNLDWWIATWMYILTVYYMNNLLMKYYMKICLYVDELLYECICWINMIIIWCCNWTMYIYEIIMLMLSVLLMSSSRRCRTLLLMLSLLLMSSSRWSCTLLLIKLLSPCILI